jgi:hypothetical protein
MAFAQGQSGSSYQGTELFPPNAKPGECYARVFVPPVYRTETVTMQKREAHDHVRKIIPAQYRWKEETVLVEEGSERIEVIPAQYEWREFTVLVKPEEKILHPVEPVYAYETEQILERPAHTVWKKGEGPVEKLSHATGEIMCLVEVPAKYKTVTKKVVKQPASTYETIIPAKYKSLKRKVMVTPPQTRTVTIPARYETVKIQELVEPAREVRESEPEQFQTVTKTVMVTDGHMEWRPVLCQTNITPGLCTSIQHALIKEGYDPGPVDGKLGKQTMDAIYSYQTDKGLPSGGLTISTIKSLGVTIPR